MLPITKYILKHSKIGRGYVTFRVRTPHGPLHKLPEAFIKDPVMRHARFILGYIPEDPPRLERLFQDAHDHHGYVHTHKEDIPDA